jgi:hypothetical protein
MGLTLIIPATHLGMSGGFNMQPMWEVRRTAAGLLNSAGAG